MAASQPKRFDENLGQPNSAPLETPGASATETQAPVIPIDSVEIESSRGASRNHAPRQFGQRNIAMLTLDWIVMAAVVALLPIGAMFLVRTNPTLSKALATPRPIKGVSAPVTPTSTTPLLPKVQATIVLASRESVSHKADRSGVVSDVRYTSDSVSAVVFVDLDRVTQFEVHRIGSPERIYLDLQNTRLAPALVGKEIQTQDRFLRALRVGEHERQTSRITLATAQTCDYSVTRAPNSSQLRIELRPAKALPRQDTPSRAVTK